MFDGKAFGVEIVGVVKDYVSRAMGPILQRLEAVEARASIPGKDGMPGTPGRDAPPVTADQIDDAVRRYIVANPPLAGADGEDGAPGLNGKDAPPVTREQILNAILGSPDLLDGAVRRHLEISPPPPGKDGRDGSDGLNGTDGTPGAPGEPGKDGVGLAGAMIDRGGHLVVTTTDGRTHPLGVVVGKDAEPGKDGRDGADGLGFDDMTADYDGERGITLRFVRGEQTKEFAFSLPVVLDRGVFKEGTAYEAGDAVTWGGSLWIAQEPTEAKPEISKSWRLAVKRGRDGKAGEPGAPGRPGKDLSKPGSDGGKG